jgi:putative membrane protein
MGRVKFDIGVTLSFLPPIHAVLNTLVAVMLVLSLLRIKKGDVAGHRRFINFALALSTVFLLCYVSYHFTTPETKFGGTGWVKTVYLLLLLTHIVLAALILPFILLAYIRGHWNALQRHRRLVKWVWPLWFYVAVTGPVCYLMLRPYYP